jgi:hypothetical protein
MNEGGDATILTGAGEFSAKCDDETSSLRSERVLVILR